MVLRRPTPASSVGQRDRGDLEVAIRDELADELIKARAASRRAPLPPCASVRAFVVCGSELVTTLPPPAVPSGAGGGKGAKGTKAPDTVSLSSDVKLMAEMSASNEAIPEVNVARVAELRELVNSGRYEPNLELVASGLIEEAILRSMK